MLTYMSVLILVQVSNDTTFDARSEVEPFRIHVARNAIERMSNVQMIKRDSLRWLQPQRRWLETWVVFKSQVCCKIVWSSELTGRWKWSILSLFRRKNSRTTASYMMDARTFFRVTHNGKIISQTKFITSPSSSSLWSRTIRHLPFNGRYRCRNHRRNLHRPS